MREAGEARAQARFEDEARALASALSALVGAFVGRPPPPPPPDPTLIEAAFDSLDVELDRLRLRLANITGRLGKTFADRSQPEHALVWLESGLRMVAQLTGPEADQVACRHAICHAQVLRLLNRPDEAEALLDLAHRRMPRDCLNDRIGVTVGYAVLAQQTGRRERGITLLEELEQEIDPSRHPEYACWVFANLAMIRDRPSGNFERAILGLQKAKRLLESSGSDPKRIAELDQSIALILLEAGEPVAALCSAIDSLARDAAEPRAEITWRVLEAAAMAAFGMHRLELGILLLKLAVERLETARAARAGVDPELGTLTLTAPQFLYDFLARSLARHGRHGEAREVIGLKLTRAASADGPARHPSMTGAESHALVLLKEGIGEQRRVYAPKLLGSIIDRIHFRLDEAAVVHHEQIAALNRELLRRLSDALPPEGQRETLILHVIQDENDFMLLAQFGGCEIPVPPGKRRLPAAELNGLAFDLLRSIRAGDAGQRERLSVELYRLLLAPVFGGAPPKIRRLLVAAPGSLHALPWSALTEDGRTYLAEHFGIVRATAPGIDLRRPPVSPARLVACAAGDGGAGFGSLPHAGEEVRALGAACLLDDPGTFTRAGLAAALPGATALHLASHFTPDPAELARSRLLLGDGTVITLAELVGLGLSHLDLVVLSACESAVAAGRALWASSFAVDHLLLAAGVPSAVGMLWRVDDAATAELMRRFYANLRLGLDKAEALARAQNAFLQGETGRDWRAPHYWAAPVLSGNWLGWHSSG